MKYILDTHTFIWFMEGDIQLSDTVSEIIEDSRCSKFISTASIWEIAIKLSVGKLGLRKSLNRILFDLSQSNINLLEVSLPHIIRVSTMELIHRDPFDRMIIAQALEENAIILGKDPHFTTYNVKLVW